MCIQTSIQTHNVMYTYCCVHTYHIILVLHASPTYSKRKGVVKRVIPVGISIPVCVK